MDTWAESISFVNDTITFEAGTYGAEDAEIIIEITDESNIPPIISLKEIGGTNTLNFYTNAISTEDDLHYWGSGSFLNTEGNAQVVFDLSDSFKSSYFTNDISVQYELDYLNPGRNESPYTGTSSCKLLELI